MKFLNLKALVLLCALFTYSAVAAFYPQNRGMVNQVTYVPTAASTTTAVATSNQVYVFTGATTQTFKLPSAITLPVDWWYEVINNSADTVTVKDNSGASVVTLPDGRAAKIFLRDKTTAAGTWASWAGAAVADLSDYYLKSAFIDTSAGLADAGKPIKTNSAGLVDSSMLPAAGASWALTGNAGLVAGTNFLGTTDGVDLVFKTNGSERLRIDSSGNIKTQIGAGLLKSSGAGTAVSVAASGTDYAPATATTSALKGNGSGGFSAAASTDLTDTANIDLLNVAQTISAAKTFSAAGASSTPSVMLTGAPFAGTGTTSMPLFFIQPTGATATTTFSTSGTLAGANAVTGFAGNLLDFRLAGAARFSVSSAGAATFASSLTATSLKASGLSTGIAHVDSTGLLSSSAVVLSGSEVSGTVGVGNGGTGQTSYTDGQLLIGNTSGNTLTKATITAGVGMSVTNGNGSISLSSVVANQAVGTCNTAATVDWSTGNSFTVTLTNGATCAFTFSNKTSGQTITLSIYQPGSTGSGAASWSSVLWGAGAAPTITTGASKTDTCTFTYNGTDTRGSCVQDIR